MAQAQYRAYDRLSYYRGPIRSTIEQAEKDSHSNYPLVIELVEETGRSVYAGTDDPIWIDGTRASGAVRFHREGPERDAFQRALLAARKAEIERERERDANGEG